MSTPRVSVAMGTRNGARFVVDQLESILAQRPPVSQLVVSDDDSSDDTVALVERAVHTANAARSDSAGVELLVRRNRPALGVRRNFEQAVSLATGDVIALSDQDDVWNADRLSTLLPLFDDPAVLLVHTDARMVDGDGAPLGRSLFQTLGISEGERSLERSGAAFDALLRRNLVTGATVLFRRSLLDRALPFPDDWVHDEWLAAVAAALDGVVLVEQQTVDYRQHGANEIGATKLGPLGMIGRLLEPRGDRYAVLGRRSRQLAERMEQWEDAVRPDHLDAIRAKVQHLADREALPRTRLARLPGVIRAARGGAYGRFGRGAPDLLRDLVQPFEA